MNILPKTGVWCGSKTIKLTNIVIFNFINYSHSQMAAYSLEN